MNADLIRAPVPAKNSLLQEMFIPPLPPRQIDAHKGSFGKIAIIGGDTGMVGAVLLAARAALYCGAGRIYANFLVDNAPVVDIFHPEIMVRSVATFTNLTQLDCIVIGPGLGQSKAAQDLLAFCIAQTANLLIDADALNLISQHRHLSESLTHRQAALIITPHPGEAARLLNTSIEEVQKNRIESAQNLANQYQVTCVLKGAGTIIASADGGWFVNTTGNPGLSSGGTGDVLSGIIGSLIAQGLSCLQAAKLGVYVHGAAADSLVAKGVGPVGLTASEIVLEAREQINLLNNLSLQKR